MPQASASPPRRDPGNRPTFALGSAWAGCILLLLGCALVGCQWLTGHPFRRVLEVRPDSIRQVEGKGARFKFPEGYQWRPLLAAPLIRVHEDGRRLPEPSSKGRVIKLGMGRYAVRGANVWFSSSDGTSPAGNGRRYEVSIPWRPRLRALLPAGAGALAALSTLALVPALRRFTIASLVRSRWALALVAWVLLLFRHVIFGGMNCVSVFPHWIPGLDPWGAALVPADQETLRTLAAGSGQIPLWDPVESTGKPILGDPSYKLFNPLSWLAVLSSDLLWLNLLVILKTLLSGVFLWRALTAWGVGRTATLVGCMLWTGNGYFQGYLDHNQADVFIFFPLALYGVRKLQLAQTGRGTWAIAASVFMFLVGGNPQSAIVGLAILASCVAFALLHAADRLRFILRIGVATALGGMLAAPEVLAMLDYHSYWVSSHGAALLKCDTGAEQFVKSVLLDVGNFAHSWAEFIPTFSFVGSALLLAGLPALARIRSPGIVPAMFVFLAVNLYLLLEDWLVPTMPLRTLLASLPGLGEMHIRKYTEGMHFASSVLAACALDTLLASARPTTAGRTTRCTRGIMVACLLAPAILILNAMYLWQPLYPLRDPGVPILTPGQGWLFYLPLLALLTACFLLLTTAASRRWKVCILTVLVALLAHDLLRVQAATRRPSASRESVRAQRPDPPEADPVVTRLLEQATRAPGSVRVLAGGGEFLPGGGNPHGIHQVQGFNALQPHWYAEWFRATLGREGGIGVIVPEIVISPEHLPRLLASPWLPLLGVGHVVMGNSYPEIPELKSLHRIVESRQLALYELANPPLDRAFLVHSATVVDSVERGIAQTAAAPELFARRALLVARPEDASGPVPGLRPEPCGALEGERVEVLKHTPNSVEIRVRANASGFVVTTETYAPAWKARLDGRAERVWLANGAFRAVRVPPGEHRLTLTYAPSALPLGVSLSILALGCLTMLTIRADARRAPRPGA